MHRLFLKCYPKLWGMELVGMEKLKEPRGFLFIALCGKKKKVSHESFNFSNKSIN